MPRSALIAGATGLIGRHLLDELLQAPSYSSVTALVRRPLAVEHPKLRAVETDFDALGSLGAALAAEDVFCCLGTTMRTAGSREAFRRVDYEYPLRLARETRLRGALQFLVVSSAGAGTGATSFYLRTKGELEAALDKVGFTSLVIVRPSILLGERTERRSGETLAKGLLVLLAPLLRGGLGRYRPVHAATVARAMMTLAGMGLYGRHVIESDRLPDFAAL